MLLHLNVNLLRLLTVLVDALSKSAIVGILLFLLLALGPIGHADLSVIVDVFLEHLGLIIHFFLLIVNSCA